jgi:hypothetical protein
MGSDGGAAARSNVRDATIPITADELESARFGFERAFPKRSARRVVFVTQGAILLVLAALLVYAVWIAPGPSLTAVHIGAWVAFSLVIGWRALASAPLKPILWRLAEPRDWPTYTILCPLYHEANGVADLVAALKRLDYPGFLYHLHPRAA